MNILSVRNCCTCSTGLTGSSNNALGFFSKQVCPSFTPEWFWFVLLEVSRTNLCTLVYSERMANDVLYSSVETKIMDSTYVSGTREPLKVHRGFSKISKFTFGVCDMTPKKKTP